jgi:hypothetical protein
MGQPNIFGVNIAGIINQNLGSLVFDLTLTKVENSNRKGNLTQGKTQSKTSHVVKGFVDTYTERQITSSLVQKGDRKIVVLGASLPSGVEPEPNDEITDEEGAVYTIVENGVTRDPAGATYECQSR